MPSTEYTHFDRLSFDVLFARKGPNQEVQVMDSSGNFSVAGITATGQFLAPDGSASGPSYSFSSDGNTGYYWVGSGQTRITGNAVDIAKFATSSITINAALRFEDAAGGQYVGFQSPATVASSHTYTLPDAFPNSNKLLQSDSSGTLTWVTAATGDLINGGNTTGATVSVGTTDSQALQLKTAGSARLVIASGGAISANTAVQCSSTLGVTGIATMSARVAMAGTSNTLANVTIGTTVLAAGSNQAGIYNQFTCSSAATNGAFAYLAAGATTAASFTNAVYASFQSNPVTAGSGSTITRFIDFRANGGTGVATYSARLADNTSFTENVGMWLTAAAPSLVGGSFIVGTGALATNATDGFLYIPSCAGAPSGTPTSRTGTCATVYDSTNNKLYVYNGAWKGVTLS